MTFSVSILLLIPLQHILNAALKDFRFALSISISTAAEFSTSSSSTQDNLLPSPSGILPTIQSESLLQIPIPTTTTTTSPGNNLNNLVSPLETESHSHTTPATLNSVSTENFPESVPNESNSEHSTAAEAQQIVKRKSRKRRKRPKIQKPDIEIKRVSHRSRNATPTEITTDDEDMITYDVEEEELEQDPFILPKGYLPEAQQIVKRKSRNRRKRPKVQKPDIEIKRAPHRSRNETPTEITTDDEDMITYDVEEEELEQDPFILPKGYLRALTPSRYRNYRE
ncbi:hypothetical protein TNCV_4328161 [Trichonephila clavipes]|nr:hypothetical protein TNCV_4328161 [Trichonephila clavipes]